MAVKKALKQETPKLVVSDGQRQNLFKWHMRLGVLLVAEAIAILLVAGAQTVPVTLQYLTTDQLASDAAGHQVLAVATRHLFDVQLSFVVAKFLIIMGVGYLLVATLLKARYKAWLERGLNKARWLIFGVAGGSMAVAIAMLSGVTDLAVLVMIQLSAIVAGLSAMAIELVGPGRRMRKLLAVIALIAAVSPWVVIKTTVFGLIMYNGNLPDFVYYIYTSMILALIGLVVAGYFRTKLRGQWADTAYTERMYLILGFLTASLLAWQIYAGALQS